MRILIIGSNGFIGSNACIYFRKKKYEVFESCIKINTSPTENVNPLMLKELFQSKLYDICINASGSSTVGFSIENEQQDYHLNFKNVEKILEAINLWQPHCKFINLSSAAVYGNPAHLPINENGPTNPISPYGRNKLLSEQLLVEHHLKNDLKTMSLRIFSVYGNGLKKQLFWDIFLKSQKSTAIELYGTGNETRDFIHIDDLMRAFEQIILHGNFDGSVINVASGKESTIKLAAHILIKNLKSNQSIKFTGLQNNADPNYWKADISKLKSMGFLPEISLEEGLKKYAQWLKELN